ncbi:SGNH/GDSL hydrolase family protein [Paraburkholderia sp. Tr-20389]|nr:SGNH/GDSL hydrolase family protein [Paraburkholderia sp. Tr-20389]
MAGYETVNGVGTVTANSAPAMLQAQLRATLGNDSITVQNNALSGTNTYQLLNGLSPYIRTLAAFLPIDSQAQIWICNFAINDARSYTTDQYGQYLTQWVATVRAAGRIAILEEPNPTTDSSVPDLRPYVAMMDYVATQMNVPIVQQYSYIQSLPLWQTMLTDGIHPNDALYAIKAQREAEVLTPIVRSLQ